MSFDSASSEAAEAPDDGECSRWRLTPVSMGVLGGRDAVGTTTRGVAVTVVGTATSKASRQARGNREAKAHAPCLDEQDT